MWLVTASIKDLKPGDTTLLRYHTAPFPLCKQLLFRLVLVSGLRRPAPSYLYQQYPIFGLTLLVPRTMPLSPGVSQESMTLATNVHRLSGSLYYQTRTKGTHSTTSFYSLDIIPILVESHSSGLLPTPSGTPGASSSNFIPRREV